MMVVMVMMVCAGHPECRCRMPECDVLARGRLCRMHGAGLAACVLAAMIGERRGMVGERA